MKNLIKKILREQWSPEAIQDLEAFHPDLFELEEQEDTPKDLKSPDELGGWKNPIVDDSPGNVPPASYSGEKYNYKTKRYYKSTISKNIFFKAVQILTKMKDDTWFTQQEDTGDNLWHR